MGVKYYVGVAKAYSNRLKRVKNLNGSPKHEMAYYIYENGSVYKKRVNKITYWIFKLFRPRWHKKKFICSECGNTFSGLIKIFHKKVECPYCN